MTDKQQATMMTPKHTTRPKRVTLVSYNYLARIGLQGILKNVPGIELIGESNGGAHAYAMIQEMKPDCIIIDLESDRNPLASIQYYKQLSPQTRVLLIADWNDIERARTAISMGAEGIVLKCQPSSVLIAMIENMNAASPSTVLDIAQVQSSLDNSSTKPRIRMTSVNHMQPIDSLTERERTVISLVAEGLSNRDISNRLSISDITVRHHLTRIFDKLGVANRQKLLISAYNLGLVDLPTSA